MNRPARWLWLGTLLCFACASTPGKEEVMAANASFYEALNVMFTGDAEPMKAVWSHADDTTYMGPMGGLETGWRAIAKMWDEQAALRLGGEVRPEEIHVMLGSSGDIAVVVDVEKGANVDAEGKPLTVSIRATNTYRRENGAWKMIGHHTDLLPHLYDDESGERSGDG